MKKKIQWILFFVCILVVTVGLTVPTQAAKNRAVKVKYKAYIENGLYERMLVKGLNSKNEVVWKYRTPKIGATELDATKCVQRKKQNRVYVFEDDRVVVFRLSDGKKLWTAEVSRKGHVYNFDEQNNLYVTGYYDQTVYKISPNGKQIWKNSLQGTDYYWAYKILIRKKNIIILYGNDNFDGKVFFSRKTGKIQKVIGRRWL